jgi:hypothetical protein
MVENETPDYDDAAVEEAWCDERRREVGEYLRTQGVEHGQIGEWPAWHVAPYVSIWAIESKAQPGYLGWWVICGDLPTDYISAAQIKNPRGAMREFSRLWTEAAKCMCKGVAHPTVKIGKPGDWAELGPLLESRSRTLATWADDGSMWEE